MICDNGKFPTQYHFLLKFQKIHLPSLIILNEITFLWKIIGVSSSWKQWFLYWFIGLAKDSPKAIFLKKLSSVLFCNIFLSGNVYLQATVWFVRRILVYLGVLTQHHFMLIFSSTFLYKIPLSKLFHVDLTKHPGIMGYQDSLMIFILLTMVVNSYLHIIRLTLKNRNWKTKIKWNM